MRGHPIGRIVTIRKDVPTYEGQQLHDDDAYAQAEEHEQHDDDRLYATDVIEVITFIARSHFETGRCNVGIVVVDDHLRGTVFVLAWDLFIMSSVFIGDGDHLSCALRAAEPQS